MDYMLIFNRIQDYLASESWVVQVVVIILATLVIDLAQKRILGKLRDKADKLGGGWGGVLFAAAARPASLLIWVIGLAFAADVARGESAAVIFTAVAPARRIGVIIAVTWFLIRFVRLLEVRLLERRVQQEQSFERTAADTIVNVLRLLFIIVAFLAILQSLGYNISGLLALGGVGGIVAGLAAKDLLANFFGRLMIYLDRPFDVGDWIRSPDKEIEGTVESVGWRLTRIRTFDKRPLYLPNSVFTSIAVENPSRMTNRRIYETIGIRYEDADKTAVIVEDVKKMLREHPEIDAQQTMIVNLNRFAPSSLDFFIYTFTRTTEWIRFHEIKQDVLLKVLAIIRRHGAQSAFPTSTIHLAGQDDGPPPAAPG